MTADADLPVWTIKPNWANGITERLSWLTDILASSYGTEQRRALRLSPRREFEMTFNPIDDARSYFDLFLHRLGSLEFMAPLFHDRGRLSAAINVGAVTVPFDTTYREFAVGDLAILIGDDPFTFDKVEITAKTDADITVAAGGVVRDWPKGASIYPLRRSRISQESMFSALTNRVGEASLQFQLNQANDIADEGAWAVIYGDYPILLDKPNRRENLDLSYLRNSLILDNEHGLRELADDAGRAFTISANSYMMVGRAEHWAFRQMLYRLRGAQAAIWVPSFNRDFELSQDRLAADAVLDIKQIGYSYTGGAVSGRAHVLIDDSVTAEINGTGAALSASEERLTLAAALGTDLPTGSFGSFLETCRLSDDTVEIKHYTDTSGAAECQLNFRSFRDERVAVDAPFVTPTDVMNADPCGSVVADYFATLTFDYDVGGVLPTPGLQNVRLVSFYRGGVEIASLTSSTGGWTDTVNGDGNITQQSCRIGVGTFYNYTADDNPFAGGWPDQIHVQQQFPFGGFPYPPGHSVACLYFNLAGETPTLLPVTSGAAGGDPTSGYAYGPGTTMFFTQRLGVVLTDFIGAP